MLKTIFRMSSYFFIGLLVAVVLASTAAWAATFGTTVDITPPDEPQPSQFGCGIHPENCIPHNPGGGGVAGGGSGGTGAGPGVGGSVGGTTPISEMDCNNLDGIQTQLDKQAAKLNDEIENTNRDLNTERAHLRSLSDAWTQAKADEAAAQKNYDTLFNALPECRGPKGTKPACGPAFLGPAAKAEVALRELRIATRVEQAIRDNVAISNTTIEKKTALVKGDQIKLGGVIGAKTKVSAEQRKKHCP